MQSQLQKWIKLNCFTFGSISHIWPSRMIMKSLINLLKDSRKMDPLFINVLVVHIMEQAWIRNNGRHSHGQRDVKVMGKGMSKPHPCLKITVTIVYINQPIGILERMKVLLQSLKKCLVNHVPKSNTFMISNDYLHRWWFYVLYIVASLVQMSNDKLCIKGNENFPWRVGMHWCRPSWSTWETWFTSHVVRKGWGVP